MWSSCQECISLKQGERSALWNRQDGVTARQHPTPWESPSWCDTRPSVGLFIPESWGGHVELCVCVCVLNIVFHSDCKACKTSIYLLKWPFGMRTKIVYLVQTDPVNYSSAHNGLWFGKLSARNSNWMDMHLSHTILHRQYTHFNTSQRKSAWFYHKLRVCYLTRNQFWKQRLESLYTQRHQYYS